MIDRNKVVDALRNCINKPKCQDCHWEECNEFHETFELPKGLVMDMFDLLKDPTSWNEQEEQKRKWLLNIADSQLAIGGADPLTEYEQGQWDGLRLAFDIMTEKQ